MIAAQYFDGRSASAKPVHLVLAHGSLHLSGHALNLHLPLHQLRLSEPFQHAPCVLELAGGGRCEIHAAQDKQALLTLLQFKPSVVQNLQKQWQAALIAVMLMVAMLAMLRAWGVPLLADKIAARVPLQVEQTLGQKSLQALEHNLFKPSQSSPALQAQAQQIFQKILPAQPRMPVRLLIRRADSIGANAFALPDGSIILTDAMLDYLSQGQPQLAPLQGEYLAAVLAHELGHLQQRHSLKNIIASSLFGAVSWSLLGDFSSVAASAPVLVLQMEFSREMESEADTYAWDLLQVKAIPPQRLLELFAAMEKNQQRKIGSQVPQWMRNSADYLSTHPAYAQRIAQLRRKKAR